MIKFVIYACKYLPPYSRIFFEELLVTLLVQPVELRSSEIHWQQPATRPKGQPDRFSSHPSKNYCCQDNVPQMQHVGLQVRLIYSMSSEIFWKRATWKTKKDIVEIHFTVGSRFATVRFTTIHFYDPCRVLPSTSELRYITVATQASFLHSVHFQLFSGVHVFLFCFFCFSAVLLSFKLHSFLMSSEPRPGHSSAK